MVGSDLEENHESGTTDFYELIEGYYGLTDESEVEVIVAFGGARKDGWRGMKFADMFQIAYDAEDGEFGNETHLDAYLYRADGANMDDESSLKLFLDYLRDGYPNYDQRFLTFWDHGNSYKGFGGDSNFKDALYLDEMARAFERSQAGTFDLIGFDACLMASVEVAKIIAPNARYMIASEELEPGHGWLWSEVIRSYASEDSIVETGKRMVDNFVQDVHEYKSDGKTLSLLDLSQYDRLEAALNPVISAYDRRRVFSSLEYSDSLIWGSELARSYGRVNKEDSRASIDLKDFAQLLLAENPNAEVGASLNQLIGAVDDFVVHSKHDGSRPNSFGIAIDAPENAGKEYEKFSAYKVNETWLAFQDTYLDYLQSDTEPPEVTGPYIGADSETVVAFDDENPVWVTTLYGFVESVGSEDYFMVVAELEADPTGYEEGEYYTPFWDQWWFTVQYNSEEPPVWIPASFSEHFVDDGREYTAYLSEIDYYSAGASVPNTAVMTLVVDENMKVVRHQINPYQDKDGEVQFDKSTFQISPGGSVQFWNWGFNLDNPSADDWFATSDGIVEFVQDPVFQLEFLEFEDEFGQPIEYYYALWAEDASGNGELYY